MALSFLQTAQDGTNLTTYTFATQNLGTAASDRYIIVAISGREVGGGSATVSSCTIGGVTATINKQAEANGDQLAMCVANVPTGATGDIVVVWSTGMTDCFIAAYRATSLASTTATDTGSSTAAAPTYDIDVVAGGFAIAISKDRSGAATATWTNLTEDYDSKDGSGNDISGSSKEFATTQTNLTVTCTWTTSTLPKAIFVSYEVSAAAAGHKNLTLLGVS